MLDEALSRVPLLRGLNAHEKEQFRNAMEMREYAQDEVIVREGETGNEFFVLLEGESPRDVIVSIEALPEVGESTTNEPDIIVAELHAGDYFGETALITHAPRTATVTAKSPTISCAVITRSVFDSLFGDKNIQARKPERRMAISAEAIATPKTSVSEVR
ncbi:MAG: hypothetical protein MHM6MM_004656 [Cercozoa sp. M6MM]